MEQWKPIDGYDGAYEVSTYGRVRSHKYKETRVLKLCPTRMGYLGVYLMYNHVRTTYRVSRLVAQAFIPNPEGKPEVDHIDTNILNNRVENLRWCTHKENYENKRTRRKMKAVAARKGTPIIQCSLDGKPIMVWLSVHEVHNVLGWGYSHIYRCLKGNANHAHGFNWKYL